MSDALPLLADLAKTRSTLVDSLERAIAEGRQQVRLLETARDRVLAGDDDGAHTLLHYLDAHLTALLGVERHSVLA